MSSIGAASVGLPECTRPARSELTKIVTQKASQSTIE